MCKIHSLNTSKATHGECSQKLLKSAMSGNYKGPPPYTLGLFHFQYFHTSSKLNNSGMTGSGACHT